MSKNGAPSKYNKEYCNKIVSFFSIPHTKEVMKTKVDKNGNEVTWYENVPNALPTFEGFAASIGVHRETLLNWSKSNEDFFDAYKKAKDLQKNMLMDLGLRGYYNPTFAIFTAKNVTDMRDKQEVAHSGDIDLGISLKDILNDIDGKGKGKPKKQEVATK